MSVARCYGARVRRIKIIGAVIGGGILLFVALLSWLVLRGPAQRRPSTEIVERTPERLARGKFLAEDLVGCMECHFEHRDDLYTWPAKPETYGQGGFRFDEHVGVPGVVSAQNITPDPETGLGDWTDGEILHRKEPPLRQSTQIQELT